MNFAFSRKVQLTREEFLRQLPDAIGALAYRSDGDDIVIGDGSKLKLPIQMKLPQVTKKTRGVKTQ